MEILYPHGSLNQLEAMEVTDTIVHGKEIPKIFCPEAKYRGQALVCAWNSLLDMNWSEKAQLEFPPGSTTELGRWNKAIPSVPRFASWELQVPTGAALAPKALKFKRRIYITEHSYSPWDKFALKWNIKLFYDIFSPENKRSSAHLPDSREEVFLESLEATQRNGCCMCRHVPSNRNTSFHSTSFIPVPPSSQEHPAHSKE